MTIHVTTERLILRNLEAEDCEGMYQLDSDPEVHRYLGNNPIQTREQAAEVIQFVQQQYNERGIGRWAVIDKNSGEFLGWCGIKLILEAGYPRQNFYEVGYRFRREFWGRGYATEACLACRDWAFNNLEIDVLYGMANIDNAGSLNVLSKCGFQIVDRFIWEAENIPTEFLELTRMDWEKLTINQ